jgi:hypothetical protein
MLSEDRSRQGHDIDAVLQKAMQESLKQLGGVSSNALLWYLSNNGFRVTDKTIDIDIFYKSMQTILGNGADLVMQLLFKKLCKDFGYAADVKMANSSMVDRINAVLLRIQEEGQAG